MKVDLSGPISLVSGRLEEIREKDKEALRPGETSRISSEKQNKTDSSPREVTNPQIPFNNVFVRLKFQIDKETGERVIQIVDSETGELVRQIPPEELLHIMKTLRDLKGLLFSTIS
jgi:flagellar protein FlaG